jgi:F-type H+-transporting ATPase subunit delta
MKKEKAAAIYARTLLETARDQKSLEAVNADMRALSETFRKLPALYPFLTNPVRRADEKAKLINAAANSVSPLVKKFLKLLEIKNRFALLRGIAEAYLILEEQRQNILRATVVSAQPLVPEQIEKLTRGLEAKRPGKTFIVTNQVDASLIAGFRIEQGDSITDASIKHKLDLLKQKLAA